MRVLSHRGFTLVEMLVAISILSLVIGGILGVVLGVQKDYVRQRDVNRAHEAFRSVGTAITTVLRSAQADPYETGDALLDPDPGGDGTFDDLRVKTDFNPADGDFDDSLEDVEFRMAGDTLKVRWQAGDGLEPFAYPVEELRIRYYDAEGTEITDAASVSTDAAKAKVELTADKGPRSTADDRMKSWIQLKN